MAKRSLFWILLAVALVCVITFLSGSLRAQGKNANAIQHAKEVQQKHTARLMAIKGVVGTAVGLNQDNRLVVKVYTAKADVPGIAKKLDDLPTQVVITGRFNALPKGGNHGNHGKPGGKTNFDPTARQPRPVPIGVSTGNAGECSAGTIACRLVDDAGKVYALSNNHVYALENAALLKSEILQPGLYDTTCVYDSADVIGTLTAYSTIDFADGTTNTIDAAIALTSTNELDNATPPNGYGTPKSTTVEAYVNQKVQKYGRTSSLTKGSVTGINATIDIAYGSRTARFVNQIIVESRKPFIKPGDSGSLFVTDPGKEPVGLLFAGNGSGKFAIANHIDDVLTAFNVTIDGQ